MLKGHHIFHPNHSISQVMIAEAPGWAPGWVDDITRDSDSQAELSGKGLGDAYCFWFLVAIM